MKRTTVTLLDEQEIITNLITSTSFCFEVIPHLNPAHFELDYARIIARWVTTFYQQFGVAPENNMLGLYRDRHGELHDEALKSNVLAFLQELNTQAKKSVNNVPYSVTQALNYMNKQALLKLSLDIQDCTAKGDIARAVALVAQFDAVRNNRFEAVDVQADHEAVIQAFTKEHSHLFSFDGALGKVCGAFNREDFFSILAPTGRGKSWWLLYTAMEAERRGFKAVFFSLEMSMDNIVRRQWTMKTQMATEEKDVNFPSFKWVDKDAFIHHTVQKTRAFDPQLVKQEQEDLRLTSSGGGLKLFALPTGEITVQDIDNILDGLVGQGFIPDVVVIDYADILKPSIKGEKRLQIGDIWLRLRGLAQRRKCLVASASQTGRQSWDRDAKTSDVSEDASKIHHSTASIVLMQDEKEQDNGIMRVKQAKIRDDARNNRQVAVLQCLSAGKVNIESAWASKVLNLNDFKQPFEGKKKRPASPKGGNNVSKFED